MGLNKKTQAEFLVISRLLLNTVDIPWDHITRAEKCIEVTFLYNYDAEEYVMQKSNEVLKLSLQALDSDKITEQQKQWVRDVICYIANEATDSEIAFGLLYDVFYKNDITIKLLKERVSKCVNFWATLPLVSIINVDQNCLDLALNIYEENIKPKTSLNKKYKEVFFSGIWFNCDPDKFDELLDENLSVIIKLNSMFDRILSSIQVSRIKAEKDIHIHSFAEYLEERLNDLYLFEKAGECVSKIEKGEIWNHLSELPTHVTICYSYPDGKKGDIINYLAKTYGSVAQIGALEYRAIFSTENIRVTEVIVSHYELFVRNVQDKKKTNAHSDCEIWRNHNNAWLLLDCINGFSYAIYEQLRKSDRYSRISDACDHVMKEQNNRINKYRDEIYEYLIVEGDTTGKWKSEQKVYAIVKSLYPDAIYQFKAEWLGLQSLDVFIPSLNIGIEYQGLQHYKPVSFFGGEDVFYKNVKRDKKKKDLCDAQGVQLIYWKYDEDISREVLLAKLSEVSIVS